MRSLPQFIYEFLPYLYMLIGVLAMTKVTGKLGIASGLLMFCIGLLVLKMRMNYRAETRAGARLVMQRQQNHM